MAIRLAAGGGGAGPGTSISPFRAPFSTITATCSFCKKKNDVKQQHPLHAIQPKPPAYNNPLSVNDLHMKLSNEMI
jgi:hypothetical protein